MRLSALWADEGVLFRVEVTETVTREGPQMRTGISPMSHSLCLGEAPRPQDEARPSTTVEPWVSTKSVLEPCEPLQPLLTAISFMPVG